MVALNSHLPHDAQGKDRSFKVLAHMIGNMCWNILVVVTHGAEHLVCRDAYLSSR